MNKPYALVTGASSGIGYIITPEKLARKGVNAMFRGRARITPGILNYVLLFLIALLPTCLLRLIRKLGIF